MRNCTLGGLTVSEQGVGCLGMSEFYGTTDDAEFEVLPALKELGIGLVARWEGIAPIPGTKRRSYLAENVAAAEVTLTAADLEQIAAAIPAAEVVGERYSEQSMRAVNG